MSKKIYYLHNFINDAINQLYDIWQSSLFEIVFKNIFNQNYDKIQNAKIIKMYLFFLNNLKTIF